MDNAYFVFSEQDIAIERFHLCTWEFKNESALIEIGGEINAESVKINKGKVVIDLYIPWLKPGCKPKDLYQKLKEPTNSKFIFNDSVVNTTSFDGGAGLLGVIHHFQLRDALCVLPVNLKPNFQKGIIEITIDLTAYNKQSAQGTNIYFRFSVPPDVNFISTRKKGISRSTIIYDVKVNERRNLPDHLFHEIQNKKLCHIASCFCFNIVPNSYDLTFFDSSSLINVRTLEYDSFNRYLGDKRVKKDELMVIFNKKKLPQSFAFFVIFTRERIGTGQFALAVLVNLISGILLFIPGYRQGNKSPFLSKVFWTTLPAEVYVAISFGVFLIGYFMWPKLIAFAGSITSFFQSKKKIKK